jgi:single-strand DNA-binding protein
MYRNYVVLIGYLARDAEARGSDGDAPYAVLTLVTKSSWRDKAGDWKTHSEYHRCVAWGARFIEVAALKRGAHLQIEGELRSREYQKDGSTQRLSEIRVGTILQLKDAWGPQESAPLDVETDSSQSGTSSSPPFT